jgi:hypothetical protein
MLYIVKIRIVYCMVEFYFLDMNGIFNSILLKGAAMGTITLGSGSHL